MFIHPSIYLLSLVVAVVIYWCIPRNYWISRAIFLIVLSVFLVSLIVPALGLFLLASSFVAYSYKWVRNKTASFHVAAAYCVAQVLLMTLPDLTNLSRLSQAFAFVGLSYFTLRNIGFIIDVYKEKTTASYTDLLFLNSFFPTYSAGPIENTKTVTAQSCDAGFNLADFQLGLARVFVGILKFYLLSGAVLDKIIIGNFPQRSAELATMTSGSWLVLAILSWLNLYIAFSGYVDIAIGSSRMFGINIRENFHFPFLATNIQNYWQRWNISVMNFVSEYVYMNFVRVTGWRIIGIFLVFLFMGMWHHVSFNYLLWGLAHGSAMAFLIFLRKQKFYQNWQVLIAGKRGISYPVTFLSWAVTLTFVSFISLIANAPNADFVLSLFK